MIDEDVLTELLREAAAAHDVPNDGPDRVAAAAGPAAVVRARRRPTGRGAALLAVAAAVLLLAVTAGVGLAGRDRQDAVTASSPGADGVEGEEAGGPATTTTTPPQLYGDSPEATIAGSGASGAASGGAAPPVPVDQDTADQSALVTDPAAGAQPRIVRNGAIEVEVTRGRFDDAVRRLSSLAAGVGGFVAGTETFEQGDAPRGVVTIRVPSGSFDQVVVEVRRLGDVRSATSHAQDVTGQYTDLEARLRALRATRDQLLTLLGRAEVIPDILAVQDRLNGVQAEIESLEGQQHLLDDQTTYATLQVSVAEPGADVPALAQERSGLSKAWHDAVDNFSGGIEAIVAGSGTVLVVALFLGLVVLLGRLVWLATRRRLL